MKYSSIEDICGGFVNKDFDIFEFQSRLQTFMLPDEVYHVYSDFLTSIDDELEDIIYSSQSQDYYENGVKIVNIVKDYLSVHSDLRD